MLESSQVRRVSSIDTYSEVNIVEILDVFSISSEWAGTTAGVK